MKAFVAGATGRTGAHIVRQLCDRDIAVCALVRDRAKAQNLLPQSVDIVVGDVQQPQTWIAALATCEVLFCATGATPNLDCTAPYRVDYLGTLELLKAAQRQDIRHFILISSLCVSQFFHPLNLFWLVLFWKHQAEKAIQASNVPYTIIRPGGLLATDNQAPIVTAPADTLFDGRIPRAKVAAAAIAALDHPAAQNKIVEIITQPDARALSWAEAFAQVR